MIQLTLVDGTSTVCSIALKMTNSYASSWHNSRMFPLLGYRKLEESRLFKVGVLRTGDVIAGEASVSAGVGCTGLPGTAWLA